MSRYVLSTRSAALDVDLDGLAEVVSAKFFSSPCFSLSVLFEKMPLCAAHMGSRELGSVSLKALLSHFSIQEPFP